MPALATPDELTTIAHKQLAVWEGLRRLGFAADDIFPGVVDDQGVVTVTTGAVKTVLRPSHQPGKEFVIDFPGSPQVDALAYKRVWKAEAERWRDRMSNDERMRIYHGNMTELDFLTLTLAIRGKDITVPNLPAAQKISF